MLDIVKALLLAFRSTLRTRRDLPLENLALRQQLCVAKRHMKRSNVTNVDRILWVALPRYWHRWGDVITIVKPETVVAWHRRGFRCYWRKKSASKPG